MTTKHELLKQLMEMKSTLKNVEALCKAHPDNSLIDEIRSLRIEIMKKSTNYFIDMVEDIKEP